MVEREIIKKVELIVQDEDLSTESKIEILTEYENKIVLEYVFFKLANQYATKIENLDKRKIAKLILTLKEGLE